MLWCVSPAALMVWLVAVRSGRRRTVWIVRHSSSCNLWMEDTVDVLVGSIVFAAATVISACAAAAVFSNGTLADFGTHGIFAAVTSQVPQEPLNAVAVTAVSGVLAFLVLSVFGIAFQLGQKVLNSPIAPFIALVALGLPIVHGPQAFLVEVARLFGYPVDLNGIANPLSLPFEVSSVFYDSWLPGANHGLWLQPILFLILFAIGLSITSRKDHLCS